MSDNAFAALRATLQVPYAEEPYWRALKRAEEEYSATLEAAKVWCVAACTEGGALACSELLFWVGQAHAAQQRLTYQRSRKRM